MCNRWLFAGALLALVACDPNPTPEVDKNNPWVPDHVVAAAASPSPPGNGAAPMAPGAANCPEGEPLADWSCLPLPPGLPPMAARWSGPTKGFAALCATCHGPDGRGNERGKALGAKDLTSPEVQGKDDAALLSVIVKGSQNTKMPAFGETIAEPLLKELVAHVRTLPSKNIKAPF